MADEIDLRAAINTVSDVIQNRPRPLREFDQIFMRAGDMVLQSEFIASLAREKSIAFVGDGDSISVCVAYMKARDIIDYGPTTIKVLDFDQRMVNAINRFASDEGLNWLTAELYNCLDPLPPIGDNFDLFYTNPPWGASNAGASVNLFVERGMELVHYNGEGVVVIADSMPELPWTSEVLTNVQQFAIARGFYVSRMMPGLHSYHLDDNPELRSCNLILRSRRGNEREAPSAAVNDPERLANFYGQGVAPSVRYVREKLRVDYGRAHDDEYELELLEER